MNSTNQRKTSYPFSNFYKVRIIVSLMLIAFIPFNLHAQIPNGGFEEWTNMGTYNNPDQWATLNDLTASAGGFTCTKGFPGNPGVAYLKLTSTAISGLGIMPGIAVSGVFNMTTMQPVSGFPFTGRPGSLDGNWQFMAYGNDQGYISVLLSRWNSALHQRDTIAYVYQPLDGMVMSWRSFSLDLNYMNGSNPDSAIITASASNADGTVISENSYLYLDNLAFSGSSTGIRAHKKEGVLRVYPNPAKQTMYLSLTGVQDVPVTIEIFDLRGQKFMSVEFKSSTGPFPVNVSQLPEGCYLAKIISGKDVYYNKFNRCR